MGNVYIGVNNIAKKVHSIYVGVNNIARKVSKGYIGVSGKARLVYTAGSGVDPTKSSFTEAEVNALAAYGEINKVKVGSTFTIANSVDTSRRVHTYIVIGKDHKDKNVDNYPSEPANTGTVDVWGTGAIAKRVFKSTTPCGEWHNSDIRTWLNGDFYNGFNSTTKVHLKQMTVEYYWTTETGYSTAMTTPGNHNTTDYVKLLSTTEFNPSNYTAYTHQREGNGYEYFPSVPSNEGRTDNAKKRYASATGDPDNDQWQRSLRCYSQYSGNSVYMVHKFGHLYDYDYYYPNRMCGIVPCFRLGA